jgi:hypothetical protein
MGPGRWPGTSERRLDGLWVADGPARGIVEWTRSDERFAGEITDLRVQVIEAKRRLNVDVIGQVVAGVDMLARSYPSTSIIDRCVVVGPDPDPVLTQVCGSWGIEVCSSGLG